MFLSGSQNISGRDNCPPAVSRVRLDLYKLSVGNFTIQPVVTGKRTAFSQQLCWRGQDSTSWLETWIDGQENGALFPAVPSG